MSSHTHAPSDDLVIGVGERAYPLKKAAPAFLLGGGILAIVSLAIMFTGGGANMLGSWLFGWYFWMTITVGMLGLTVLHHTVRGSWALPWLKLIQAGSGPASLALMFLLFLPVLLQPALLYHWVHPEGDHLLMKKAFFLNQGFWTGRTIFYFLLWIGIAAFMAGSVKRQENGGGFKLEAGRSSWGAVSIVLFVISWTFAATDWGMSLEPHWYSTIYGVWQMIGGALGASAFCVVILCLNAKKAPYTEVITPNLTKDWGNILFMFTMLWAYTSISQYLIIWNGNLPETTQYFARRGRDLWNAIGMTTIVGQFLVPWMSLLSPRVKRYPHLLRGIAGWIFVMHIVDVYLAIGPALPGHSSTHGRVVGENILFDVLGFLAVGCLWLFAFSYMLGKEKNLLPTYDTRLQEALKHAH